MIGRRRVGGASMRLIYIAPVAWDSYEQRPHYFVRHFLAAGAKVLWVDPYAARLPSWRDAARIVAPAASLSLARPAGLDVLAIAGLPIDPLPGGARVNERLFWRAAMRRLAEFSAGGDTILGIGRPTAFALAALRSIQHRWSFYDAMDDFPEFYRGRSRRATQDVERAIAALVSRLFVSSSGLAAKFGGAGERVTHVPNAYDMALLPPPVDRSARPSRIGFLGCMGAWFDWTLVARLAERVNPMPVTLVGPAPALPPADLPANIERQPPCHQRETVHWLDRFTVGLIPFTRTPLTASVDPIKYYQYRGAGLPILTTSFGDMVPRAGTGGTFAIDDGRLDSAVSAALAYRAVPADVLRFREEHTWTRRFEDARICEPS